MCIPASREGPGATEPLDTLADFMRRLPIIGFSDRHNRMFPFPFAAPGPVDLKSFGAVAAPATG